MKTTLLLLGLACAAGYFYLTRMPLRSEPGGDVAGRSEPNSAGNSLKTAAATVNKTKNNKHLRPRVAEDASRDRTTPNADAASYSAIPTYREDIRVLRSPQASDVKAGGNEQEVLRKFGAPDLQVSTSAGSEDRETLIYVNGKTNEATSVELQNGRVVQTRTDVSSRPTFANSGVAGAKK